MFNPHLLFLTQGSVKDSIDIVILLYFKVIDKIQLKFCLIGSNRFIPSRSTTDIDLGHFALMNENSENADPEPNNAQYQQHLNEALNKGQNPHNTKILSFKNKAPDAPEGL